MVVDKSSWPHWSEINEYVSKYYTETYLDVDLEGFIGFLVSYFKKKRYQIDDVYKRAAHYYENALHWYELCGMLDKENMIDIVDKIERLWRDDPDKLSDMMNAFLMLIRFKRGIKTISDLKKRSEYDFSDNGKFVYFLQMNGPEKLIKIGESKSPYRRYKNISGRLPYECELRGIIREERYSELELHKRFAEYRMKGEWFRASESLLSFIDLEALPLSYMFLPKAENEYSYRSYDENWELKDW